MKNKRKNKNVQQDRRHVPVIGCENCPFSYSAQSSLCWLAPHRLDDDEPITCTETGFPPRCPLLYAYVVVHIDSVDP